MALAAQAMETFDGLKMPDPKKILVFHTAFLGDVILNLPMVQILKREYPNAEIDVAAIPNAAQVLQNHPAIHRVIEYDKRGSQKGIAGMVRMIGMLRQNRYDLAIVSHRSMRSALIVAAAGIPRRICFSKSAGRWFFTDVVTYQPSLHEVERNISLLQPLNIKLQGKELPSVYPSADDIIAVNQAMQRHGIDPSQRFVAIAPGSVWATKRWPPEHFAELVRKIADRNWVPLLIGGPGDRELCISIAQLSQSQSVQNFAGELTVLQSAELLRRCAVVISNDSAPVHLAVAVRTPVIAIFGPTVPAFGFGPYGISDRVVQIDGLKCRPCSIHGGDVCPIGTFVCMKDLRVENVMVHIDQITHV